MNSPYNTAMGVALDAARDAASLGDIPVGAVVVDASGNVLAVGRNYREERSDPFSHAEIEAMRAVAGARGTWNLEDCTLVVTLEPCPMCAGAAVSAHMGRVVLVHGMKKWVRWALCGILRAIRMLVFSRK